MNKWKIPEWLETEVRDRDVSCVYCGCNFTDSKKNKKQSATWEHIVNNAKIVTRKNITLCCCACNASKGAKELSKWLTTEYCKRKNITSKTVAKIIRKALINPPTKTTN